MRRSIGSFLLTLLLAGSTVHAQPVEYALDDGDGETNQGPPSTFDPQMLWGNYFVTEPGGEVVTEISAAFGSTFPSLQDSVVTFWLLDDPDQDLDPRNATMLARVEAVPTLALDVFFSVEIPPTEVSGAFFVGVSASLVGGADRPARVDTDDDGSRSWFFYDPDIAGVIDSLGTAAFGTRMDDPKFVLFPGAFMIRATGEPRLVATETRPSPVPISLHPSFPNPLRTATTISYTLPDADHVTVSVYDVTGRLIATLADGVRPPGEHTVQWDATGLAAGTYLCRMQAGAEVRMQRLTVLP